MHYLCLLNIKKERDLVCKLVTGDITMDEFTSSPDITSENGEMMKHLVAHIDEKFPFQIPLPYVTFLSCVSKNSSTRSLLQVTSSEPLEILNLYCREELDLRVVENETKIKILVKRLPVLWPILDAICGIERTKYLPRPVALIISKFIKYEGDQFLL